MVLTWYNAIIFVAVAVALVILVGTGFNGF
jgi:hypothetical protein